MSSSTLRSLVLELREKGTHLPCLSFNRLKISKIQPPEWLSFSNMHMFFRHYLVATLCYKFAAFVLQVCCEKL